MFITRLELKLYFNKGVIICAALLALLSLTAGLLGDRLLYGGKLIPRFTLYIVDNDKSVESKMLLDALESFKADTMKVTRGSEAEAREAVERGEAAAALLIPENFFADIMSGVNSGAQLLVNRQNAELSELIKLFAESIKEQLSASQAGIYYILSKAPDDNSYNIYMNESNIVFLSVFMGRTMEAETVSLFGEISNKDYFTFCFYVFTMFSLSCLLFESGCKIKKGDVLALLLSKGESILKVFAYKLLSITIVFAVLNTLMIGLMLMTGVFSGIGIMGIVILFALLTVSQSAFCCFCIWIFDDVKATGVFIFISGLTALFFSGGILPLVFLPDTIKSLSRFTPNYYLTSVFISEKAGRVVFSDVLFVLLFVTLALAFSYAAACSQAKRGGRNELFYSFAKN